MIEISYLYYKYIIKHLNLSNIDDVNIEYCKKIILLAKMDPLFKEYILTKKFDNLKYITPRRAKEIINTSNPKFNKYYNFADDKLEFWISDEPYYHYIVDMEQITESVKKELLNQIKILLQENNYIKI